MLPVLPPHIPDARGVVILHGNDVVQLAVRLLAEFEVYLVSMVEAAAIELSLLDIEGFPVLVSRWRNDQSFLMIPELHRVSS
jgi:hypothetical protein